MKKLILFILVISILSCNHQKTEKMETNNNENLVRTYFEHFNNHDWKKMADMYTLRQPNLKILH